MDVHPPLAKLLITLAGWLGGFDGDFDFKDIGKDYLAPGVPYVAMRMVAAVCGILTIPTIFLTLKASGCRTVTAALGAGLLILGKRSQPRNDLRAYNLRKRTIDPIAIDPSRCSSRMLHCHNRALLDLLHQPT
jgi:Dolichyl-phosphate-mannose-protein mannosyltransferase